MSFFHYIGGARTTEDTQDLLQPGSGETGLAPAPKEQPPRKLSGKRTDWLDHIWKEARPYALNGMRSERPPTG